jgi:hypothetical protein
MSVIRLDGRPRLRAEAGPEDETGEKVKTARIRKEVDDFLFFFREKVTV